MQGIIATYLAAALVALSSLQQQQQRQGQPLLLLPHPTSVILPRAPGRHIMFSEYALVNRLVEMDKDGNLLWEHKFPSLAVMFRVLPNGNVLYAYGGSPTGVQEVDHNHNIVWDYKADCEQVLGFERMPNGNILIGEQGPCRAVEVNRKGEVVRTISLTTQEKGAHRQIRSIHPLPKGGLLVAHEGDGVVREYDSNGKVVWEYSGVPNVFEAVRLKNGDTLITSQSHLRQVDKNRKTIWELNSADAPDVELTWLTSIQRLKNHHLIIADFKRDAQGKGAHAFEVTRDKKIVWRYADHDLVKILTFMHVFED